MTQLITYQDSEYAWLNGEKIILEKYYFDEDDTCFIIGIRLYPVYIEKKPVDEVLQRYPKIVYNQETDLKLIDRWFGLRKPIWVLDGVFFVKSSKFELVTNNWEIIKK